MTALWEYAVSEFSHVDVLINNAAILVPGTIEKMSWRHFNLSFQINVASVSAPVRSPDGRVVAAVSVSGPIERLTRAPGPRYAQAVLATAARLGDALADGTPAVDQVHLDGPTCAVRQREQVRGDHAAAEAATDDRDRRSEEHTLNSSH